MSRIAEQVTELARPIADELGLELFDVEYVKEGGTWVLRVTIDAEAGISHAECEAMSRRLDEVLDQRDLIAGAYNLEVSSPGAERPLRSAADFARFAGKQVLVKTYAPFQGRKEWQGELVGQVDGELHIKGPQGDMAFPQDQVSLVRLTID